MKKVGVVDIGSNTVVLALYIVEDDRTMKKTEEYSEACGLIGHIHNGELDNDATIHLLDVLRKYRAKMASVGVDSYYSFTTEPGRKLSKEAFHALRYQAEEMSFNLKLLSGEEEATCDFYGSRLDWKELSSGLILDIGGGSTELIRYHSQKIQSAVSLPMGCVVISKESPSSTLAQDLLQNLLSSNSHFKKCKAETMIGIGGTIKALARITYPSRTEKVQVPLEEIKDTLKQLEDPDSLKMQEAKKIIPLDRLPLLVPGGKILTMVCDQFQVSNLCISNYGVREGFLYQALLHKAKLTQEK